jgi:hypothetical protein
MSRARGAESMWSCTASESQRFTLLLRVLIALNLLSTVDSARLAPFEVNLVFRYSSNAKSPVGCTVLRGVRF